MEDLHLPHHHGEETQLPALRRELEKTDKFQIIADVFRQLGDATRVRQVRNRFRIDYGKTIEDFLESVYLAGADLSGTELEHQAKCIEQSHKMLCLVDSAVDLMRAKHKNGEEFYWLLYYAYLSPQELQNVEEILDQLRPHIRDISTRTYYRKRKEAVEVLSSVLWGYTAQDSAGIVREFVQ